MDLEELGINTGTRRRGFPALLFLLEMLIPEWKLVSRRTHDRRTKHEPI